MKLILTLGAAGALAAANLNLENNAPTAPAPRVDGSIRGRVVFEGEKPEIKPLTISADQAKGCCAEGEMVDDTDDSLLIGEDGGIHNVVVTLTVKGAEAPKPTEQAVELDQKGCRFQPHMIVVPVGSKVAFANSDSVSHNIHTYPLKNTPLNQTVAAGGKIEMKLDKAEEVKVGCDIHPWMASYVVVTDATYYALTDASGAFELKGVPPGDYKLDLWHEKLGKEKADVTVKADGTADPVEVKMSEKKKAGGRRGR